ncbi:MAG TPA: hypothetical protein VK306_10410 [Acidimicrobiales bacterium]|nr:hypothetical protein [Acidimicrobiales bacterium]
MARLSFRDRFFTPKVARAIMSPSGILLAGGVAAVAIVAGLPLLASLPLGAAAWAGKVALAVPRNPAERIDPFGVQEPWRRFVQEALQARNRFDEVVHRIQPGPLQDNLRSVAERIHAGVEESWRIAQRGQALDQARRGIDVAAIARHRAELGGDRDDPVFAQVSESLDAQQASADRLDRVIAEAQSRLRVLDARMDEALARAIELAAQSSTTASVGTLGTDVDNLVTEMEALRQALEETHGTPGGLASPGGQP